MRGLKLTAMCIGLLCLTGLWFLLGELPLNTRIFAMALCAFYGSAAHWSGVMSK